MKPSKAQQELLAYIKTGGKVSWRTGLNTFPSRSDNKLVNITSLKKLETLKLIKQNTSDNIRQYEAI